MIHWLTEPFTLEFMQRALAASLIVGVVCSVLGCFVVLRAHGLSRRRPGARHPARRGHRLPAGRQPARRRAGGGGAGGGVHRPLLAPGRRQGGHGHRHPVRGRARPGRGAHQHGALLRHRPDAHPVRQRARRELRRPVAHRRPGAGACWPPCCSCTRSCCWSRSTPCWRTRSACGRSCCASSCCSCSRSPWWSACRPWASGWWRPCWSRRPPPPTCSRAASRP